MRKLRRFAEGLLGVVIASALVPSGTARGDEAPGVEIRLPGEVAVFKDPQLQKMWALDRIAPFEDKAPLWDYRDADLQEEVEKALARLELDDDVRRKRLSLALIDITDVDRPRVAEVNGDVMMYAASLPKIAVLLAAFELIATGKLEYDADTRRLLKAMIQRSSNSATTKMMHRVGKENIARVLLSPRYRLYDPSHNGGLWVGKDYAKAGLWKRDPLYNLSHAATAMQVARFYYLMETGNLVTPSHSEQMKELMTGSELDHKFAAGLHHVAPSARFLRKSGSWRNYHSDSALVRRAGKTYIVVALSNDADGNQWLVDIAAAMDGVIRREGRAPTPPDRPGSKGRRRK
ncbi:MAG: serine hydrolase [Myxococcota bacterium]